MDPYFHTEIYLHLDRNNPIWLKIKLGHLTVLTPFCGKRVLWLLFFRIVYRFEGNIFCDQKLLVSKIVIISGAVLYQRRLILRFGGLTLYIEFKKWRENEPCPFISCHRTNCSDMPLGLCSVISKNDRICVENIQNMPCAIMVKKLYKKYLTVTK